MNLPKQTLAAGSRVAVFWPALAVWGSGGFLVGLLLGEHYSGVLHPWFAPFAILLLVHLGALLVAVARFGLRLVRGPGRTRAAILLIVSAIPPLLMAAALSYARGDAANAGSVRQNLPWVFAKMFGASMIEGQAWYIYPRRIETRRLVMFYDDDLAEPYRDAEEMDRFVAGLEERLGQPLPVKIHWLRGNGVGYGAISLYAIACGTRSSPVSWSGDEDCLDRHELCHAAIAQCVGPRANPPRVLMEGWAESQSGLSSRKLAGKAANVRLRSKEPSTQIASLLDPTKYDQGSQEAYGIGGALVDFLSRRIGWERSLDLYRSCSPADAASQFQTSLGCTLDELSEEFWEDVVRQLEQDEVAREYLRAVLASAWVLNGLTDADRQALCVPSLPSPDRAMIEAAIGKMKSGLERLARAAASSQCRWEDDPDRYPGTMGLPAQWLPQLA